ncbi:JmjC domain-containing protein [Pycnococcus provasolii]
MASKLSSKKRKSSSSPWDPPSSFLDGDGDGDGEEEAKGDSSAAANVVVHKSEESSVPFKVMSYSSPPSCIMFYRECISQRQCAVIKAHPWNDKKWLVTAPTAQIPSSSPPGSGFTLKWNDSYLASKAGAQIVTPMVYSLTNKQYTRGKSMPFREFIHNLNNNTSVDQKSEEAYMTTQPAAFDSQGRLTVANAPTPPLLDDMPLRPEIMGKLTPAAYNLWMGKTSGKSSGLHQDWHDNLYVLLRGTKKFKLWPASLTQTHMKPIGTVAEVFDNGRVRYEGAERCREDGATARDARRVADVELAKAEQQLDTAEASGDKKRIQSARKAVEQAEERLDSALAFAVGGFANIEEEDEEEEDGGDSDAFDDDDDDDDDFDDDGGDDDEGQQVDGENNLPHFSSVSSDQVVANSTEIVLRAGEMLYLPAGTWHDVTSYHDGDKDGGAHLALNFWYHPPSSKGSFEAPYEDDLWERDFQLWCDANGRS